jgi:glycosyltransferase A (GT-A) superfamily protein (DUF2064 family)
MQSQNNLPHLVLVFKAPQRAKSRLRQKLKRADELASLLLDCALEDLRGWHGPVTVAATADEDAHWLARDGRWSGDVVIQHSGNLGERLIHVDLALRRQGHKQVLIIGSDCPAMNQDYLATATTELDRHAYVLGGAQDGGVSLMGAAQPWPALADLPWSTDQLGAELAKRCELRNMLPLLRDVDEVADLTHLAAELSTDTRPTRVALKQWLNSWQA